MAVALFASLFLRLIAPESALGALVSSEEGRTIYIGGLLVVGVILGFVLDKLGLKLAEQKEIVRNDAPALPQFQPGHMARKPPISTAELIQITRRQIEQTSDPVARAHFEEVLRSNIALETEAAEALGKMREQGDRMEKLARDTRIFIRILPWALLLIFVGTFLVKFYWR